MKPYMCLLCIEHLQNDTQDTGYCGSFCKKELGGDSGRKMYFSLYQTYSWPCGSENRS